MKSTQNINIENINPLTPPQKLKQGLEASEPVTQIILKGREEIINVLNGTDERLLVILGPCSIHDEKVALDYAKRLSELAPQLKDRLCVVMRVYFEKPRTTVGWKGLINDPYIDGSYRIEEGLKIARRILLEITKLGLPTATEFLDPIVPQYISDLVCWAAIGARTTESQTHREMASGLSMPVGYKNSTDGNLQVAINAMQSASHSHHFLGINQEGQIIVIQTKGNPWGHVILRGGEKRPNYDQESIKEAVEKLESVQLNSRVMVDCSHANSGKKHEKQEIVWKSVIDQRVAGNKNLVGMMLESNINEGNQKLTKKEDLKYGISITDACVSWEKTEELLKLAHEMMGKVI